MRICCTSYRSTASLLYGITIQISYVCTTSNYVLIINIIHINVNVLADGSEKKRSDSVSVSSDGYTNIDSLSPTQSTLSETEEDDTEDEEDAASKNTNEEEEEDADDEDDYKYNNNNNSNSNNALSNSTVILANKSTDSQEPAPSNNDIIEPQKPEGLTITEQPTTGAAITHSNSLGSLPSSASSSADHPPQLPPQQQVPFLLSASSSSISTTGTATSAKSNNPNNKKPTVLITGDENFLGNQVCNINNNIIIVLKIIIIING